MADMTYDPEADAVYLYLGRGKIAKTAEIQLDLVADYDAEGRLLGLEFLSASRQLAPGTWSKSPLPGQDRRHWNAAE